MSISAEAKCMYPDDEMGWFSVLYFIAMVLFIFYMGFHIEKVKPANSIDCGKCHIQCVI